MELPSHLLVILPLNSVIATTIINLTTNLIRVIPVIFPLLSINYRSFYLYK